MPTRTRHQPGAVTDQGRSLAPATVRAYAGDWAVFADWCAVNDVNALPAEPDTVVTFLAECRCAPATGRRRIAAIDHHHAAAGQAKPGESTAVRALLCRPIGNSFKASPDTIAAVEAALRGLPSQGWTRGMFGRRDRCLLVLSQLAEVSYKQLAHMVVSNVQVADGAASVANARTLAATENPVLCGACAVARWLRVLDLTVTKFSTAVLKEKVGKANRLTSSSPHLCRLPTELDEQTLSAPLFPPITQWGAVPFPLQHLTPHSLSQRVRDVLAGDLGSHRDLPVDPDDTEPKRPAAVPGGERALYSPRVAEEAWKRRRADLRSLDGVANELTEVDRRLNELNQRTAALLADNFGAEPTNVG